MGKTKIITALMAGILLAGCAELYDYLPGASSNDDIAGFYTFKDCKGGLTIKRESEGKYAFWVELSDGKHMSTYASPELCTRIGNELTCPGVGLDEELKDIDSTVTLRFTPPNKLLVIAPREITRGWCGASFCWADSQGWEYTKKR